MKCYILSGYEIQTPRPLNLGEYRDLRALTDAADSGGTIQADRLVGILRDPSGHRTMSVAEAVARLVPGAVLAE